MPLRPVDRLAIEALARHICLGERYLDALAAVGDPRGLSASTLSRRLTAWKALGCPEPLTSLPPDEGWQGLLQQAMAGRSYPWYCQHLREEAGLLLDDELLRRMARGERDPERALLRALGVDPGPLGVVRRRTERVVQRLASLRDDQPVLALVAPAGSATGAILTALKASAPPPFTSIHARQPPSETASAELFREWFAYTLAPPDGPVSAALLHDQELRCQILTQLPVLFLVRRGAARTVLSMLFQLLAGSSSRAIVVTTEEALGEQRCSGPRCDVPLLTSTEAIAVLREVLGYRGRLTGQLGSLEQGFWAACGGRLGEALALAEQLRWWIRRACSTDAATRHLTPSDLLTRAWKAVQQASNSQHADRGMPLGSDRLLSPAWQALTDAQRLLLHSCAALPGRPWDSRQLALLAGVPEAALDLRLLVFGGWLVPAGRPGDDHYVCPNRTRRTAQGHAAPIQAVLAALGRLWSGHLAPLLHAQQSYRDVLAVYVAEVDDTLVAATLEVIKEAGDQPECLPLAVALLRVMWRHLSDILQPSGRTQLHLRLVRLADSLFDALPAAEAPRPEGAAWADRQSEHALVAAERCFLCWCIQEPAEASAALEHATSLLPPLADALASVGGRRQCLLTVHANLIAYGVLLVRDQQRRGVVSADDAIRQLLAFLDRHAAIEQAETADELRRHLAWPQRRNYPAW